MFVAFFAFAFGVFEDHVDRLIEGVFADFGHFWKIGFFSRNKMRKKFKKFVRQVMLIVSIATMISWFLFI